MKVLSYILGIAGIYTGPWMKWHCHLSLRDPTTMGKDSNRKNTKSKRIRNSFEKCIDNQSNSSAMANLQWHREEHLAMNTTQTKMIKGG